MKDSIIIDATDLILGRMAVFVAKNALEGRKIDIVNCEKAVVSGNKKYILAKYKQKNDRGIPSKGPFFPKHPDRLVRRTVRGMLPWKRTRGREAFKRVMCYNSIPEEFKNMKLETVKEANVEKLPDRRYIKIKDICRHLGAKL